MELIHDETCNTSEWSESQLLRKAIEMARSGNTAAARVLLVDICRRNNRSELGWFWLASVARNPKERMACIQQVLRINPDNALGREWRNRLAEGAAAVPPAALPEPVGVEEPEPEAEPQPILETAPVAVQSSHPETEAPICQTELAPDPPPVVEAIAAPEPPPVVEEVASEPTDIELPAANPQDMTSGAAAETVVESRTEPAPATICEAPEVVPEAPAEAHVSSFPALFEVAPVVEAPPVLDVTPSATVEEPAAEVTAPVVYDVEFLATEEEPLPASREVEEEIALHREPPVLHFVAVSISNNSGVYTFPNVGSSEPAALPQATVPALDMPEMMAETAYSAIPAPEANSPELTPAPVAVNPATAGLLTVFPSSNVALQDLPALKPAVEVEPEPVEVAEVPVPEAPAAKAETELEPCPLCEEPLGTAEYCPSCKSSIWPEKPLDFVLNRSVDHERMNRVIERLQSLPGGPEVELRLALANCNLHQFGRARVHLERAAMMDWKVTAFALDRMAAFLQRPVVLVVDDSATIREVLLRLLGNDVYLPVPIGNAWEVLPAVKEHKPAAVLLDVTMPMMDGYEVCRQVRADRETKSTPIVMVSGNVDLIDKVVGKLAGASDYLSKPFRPDQLLNVVRGHVLKKR